MLVTPSENCCVAVKYLEDAKVLGNIVAERPKRTSGQTVESYAHIRVVYSGQ